MHIRSLWQFLHHILPLFLQAWKAKGCPFFKRKSCNPNRKTWLSIVRTNGMAAGLAAAELGWDFPPSLIKQYHLMCKQLIFNKLKQFFITNAFVNSELTLNKSSNPEKLFRNPSHDHRHAGQPLLPTARQAVPVLLRPCQ